MSDYVGTTPVTDWVSDFDSAYAGFDPSWPYLDEVHNGVEPEAALRAVGLLRRYLDEAEDEWVIKARGEGRSWSYIAGLLGRSKQAVWERHRDRDEIGGD